MNTGTLKTLTYLPSSGASRSSITKALSTLSTLKSRQSSSTGEADSSPVQTALIGCTENLHWKQLVQGVKPEKTDEI